MGKELDSYFNSHRATEEVAEETTETTETTEVENETTEETTETTEETTETTEEIQQETEETEETADKPALDINEVATFFDVQGKTEDEIRSLLKSGQEAQSLKDEIESLKTENETLKGETERVKQSLNPINYFVNEDSYRAEQLKKKYPDKNSLAIQRVVTEDLSAKSALDLLVLDAMVNIPGVSETEVREALLKKRYGIEPDTPEDEWEPVDRTAMKLDANSALTRLKQFKTEVELPEVVAPEEVEKLANEKRQKLLDSWKPAIDKLKQFDKITVPGSEGETLVEFNVPAEFRAGLDEYFNEMVTSAGITPDEDSIAFMIADRNKNFVYENLPQIVQTAVTNALSKKQEEIDKENHNEKPENTETKPAEEEKEEGGMRSFLDSHKGRRRR